MPGRGSTLHQDDNVTISGSTQRMMLMQKLARNMDGGTGKQASSVMLLKNMATPEEVDETLQVSARLDRAAVLPTVPGTADCAWWLQVAVLLASRCRSKAQRALHVLQRSVCMDVVGLACILACSHLPLREPCRSLCLCIAPRCAPSCTPYASCPNCCTTQLYCNTRSTMHIN